jgi:AcrR family transcriptional regulator
MSTPGPARKPRRDALRNRRRVLDAADAVFAEQGLDAGVEDVARAAGVGVGTLYRRFPTKEALIAELVREVLTAMVTAAEEARDVPDGRGFEQFIEVAAAAQASHRGCLGRLWAEMSASELRAECRAMVAELLTTARAAGRIREDATAADIDLLFWSLRGVLEATRGTQPDAWRRHVELMLAGLRP